MRACPADPDPKVSNAANGIELTRWQFGMEKPGTEKTFAYVWFGVAPMLLPDGTDRSGKPHDKTKTYQ